MNAGAGRVSVAQITEPPPGLGHTPRPYALSAAGTGTVCASQTGEALAMKFRGFENFLWTALAASVALFAGTAPLAAKGSSGPKVRPSTMHAPKTTSHANTTAHGNHGTTRTAGASKTGRTTGSKSKGETTSTTGTSTTMTPSEAQALLAKNTSLRTKLQSRLPAGTNINDAAAGFHNLGQFVAAVNVSDHLRIPFADLKAKMTGTNAVSLGQAIQQLKGMSTTTANTTAQTALTQANREIESTSSSTTSSSAKGKKSTASTRR